ncbi:hypothetical protein FGO68_gene11241 [Halteria grandinella]|uniref:protein-histidine N-methyltransferase n=1 Tax=Halteria grandinella TaxID=5974 RepID=A0A8J8NDI0_HALGN|nr:hypothetical protein FGO68_gene11241 [Halteria grandinella]
MELTAPEILGFPDQSPTIKTLDLLHTLSGESCPIHYHVLSNKQHLSKTLSGQNFESDLVPGVYEGGLKLWECSIDLARYIVNNREAFIGKRVLELGCGQGIPGIATLKYGQAAQVVFQDYNDEVVENATKRAVQTNTGEELMGRCLFISGSWESIAAQPVAEEMKFEFILMSETLYNTSYYDSLVSVIDRTLKFDGQVIIGTKTFYFGLGGGHFEFQRFLSQKKQSGQFHLSVIEKLNDLKSIERMVLLMRRGEAPQEEKQAEQMEDEGAGEEGFQLSF